MVIFYLESTVSCNTGGVVSVRTPIHYLDFAPEESWTGGEFQVQRTVVRSFSSTVACLCSLKTRSVNSAAYLPFLACRLKSILYVTPSCAVRKNVFGHGVFSHVAKKNEDTFDTFANEIRKISRMGLSISLWSICLPLTYENH